MAAAKMFRNIRRPRLGEAWNWESHLCWEDTEEEGWPGPAEVAHDDFKIASALQIGWLSKLWSPFGFLL